MFYLVLHVWDQGQINEMIPPHTLSMLRAAWFWYRQVHPICPSVSPSIHQTNQQTFIEHLYYPAYRDEYISFFSSRRSHSSVEEL